jgi:hypothetical protein
MNSLIKEAINNPSRETVKQVCGAFNQRKAEGVKDANTFEIWVKRGGYYFSYYYMYDCRIIDMFNEDDCFIRHNYVVEFLSEPVPSSDGGFTRPLVSGALTGFSDGFTKAEVESGIYLDCAIDSLKFAKEFFAC